MVVKNIIVETNYINTIYLIEKCNVFTHQFWSDHKPHQVANISF